MSISLLGVTTEPARAQSEPACPSDFFRDRIVTPGDVERAVPGSAKPLWVLGWPCRAIYGGMEKGLIAFEKGRVREKLHDWRERLAASGFRPLFGGLGGSSATLPAGPSRRSAGCTRRNSSHRNT